MNNKSIVDKLSEKNKKAVEENQKEYSALKKAFTNVFSTKDGIRIAKFLKQISLYDDMPENFIDTSHGGMAYEKGRRHTWLILRKLMPKGALIKVEIDE